jgi:hypothetical protein
VTASGSRWSPRTPWRRAPASDSILSGTPCTTKAATRTSLERWRCDTASVGDLYYSFGSLFVGLRRLGYRFATGLIDVVLLVGLVLLAVRLGWTLSGVLVCYVVSSVTLVAVTAPVVR